MGIFLFSGFDLWFYDLCPDLDLSSVAVDVPSPNVDSLNL